MNAAQSLQILGAMAVCWGIAAVTLYALGFIARIIVRTYRHFFPTKTVAQ